MVQVHDLVLLAPFGTRRIRGWISWATFLGNWHGLCRRHEYRAMPLLCCHEYRAIFKQTARQLQAKGTQIFCGSLKKRFSLVAAVAVSWIVQTERERVWGVETHMAFSVSGRPVYVGILAAVQLWPSLRWDWTQLKPYKNIQCLQIHSLMRLDWT